MKARRQKLPTTVLERAKAAVEAVPARRPAPQATTKAPKASPARAKVVAALKKLHPMD